MSPEQVLRDYFRAKDGNRPDLLASVFARDARLEICSHSDQMSFPAVTVGLDGIADVLVRRFNQSYENVHSFYMDRPGPDDDVFSCDWLVGMTDKASRAVRVGCGRYDWVFRRAPTSLAARLNITIERMVVLHSSQATTVLDWLSKLAHPWIPAVDVIRTLPLPELAPVSEYLGCHGEQVSSPAKVGK